jgi:hypothetical protein
VRTSSGSLNGRPSEAISVAMAATETPRHSTSISSRLNGPSPAHEVAEHGVDRVPWLPLGPAPPLGKLSEVPVAGSLHRASISAMARRTADRAITGS